MRPITILMVTLVLGVAPSIPTVLNLGNDRLPGGQGFDHVFHAEPLLGLPRQIQKILALSNEPGR